MHNDKIDLPSSYLWFEDGVFIQEYKPHLKMTLEYAKETVETRLELFNGISYPVLVDARNLVSGDQNVGDYLASDKASELVSAGAVLVSNQINKMLVNFYLKFNKPKIPAKYFTSKEEAIKWLKPFTNTY